MLNIFKISRVVDKASRPYAILLYSKANYGSKFNSDLAHNLKRFEALVNDSQLSSSLFRSLCSQRFYTTCKDDKSKKPPKPKSSKKDECKTPLVCPPPRGPPKEVPREPYPYLDHCPHSKKPPLPICEDELVDEKKYIKYLVLGVLLTAAALGTLYFIKANSKKDDLGPKKVGPRCTRKKILERFPAKEDDIPDDIQYLIIGAGTAAFSAFRAIKSNDPTAKVLMITKECRYPYMRPPLSKEIWYNEDTEQAAKFIFRQWNGSARSIFYEPDEFYTQVPKLTKAENGGVAVARGYEVDRIDPTNCVAYLKDSDREIKYGKCLIATGSSPKSLPLVDRAIENNPEIEDRLYLYRSVEDFKELYETMGENKAIAIIGGGFLGSELACSLSRKGKSGVDIYQIIREPGNMARVLPEYLSQWTTQKVRDEGVEVLTDTSLVSVELKDDRLNLMLSNGQPLIVDQLVVAIGVQPNTQMAEKSDLEVEPDCGGFLVNTELQARTNLYIAGDCSCFFDAKLGRRRIEHHDHAVVSGRLAGENMTGAAQPYKHQSMFWSDLGPDVGYEAIGVVDSALPTVGVFAKATEADSPKAVVTATDEGIRSITEEEAEENEKEAQECRRKGHTMSGAKAGPRVGGKMQAPPEGEDFGKGVVFYLRDDIVVGIVLWNVFNRMSVARQVLDDGRKYEDLNEVAKLFNIHEE